MPLWRSVLWHHFTPSVPGCSVMSFWCFRWNKIFMYWTSMSISPPPTWLPVPYPYLALNIPVHFIVITGIVCITNNPRGATHSAMLTRKRVCHCCCNKQFFRLSTNVECAPPHFNLRSAPNTRQWGSSSLWGWGCCKSRKYRPEDSFRVIDNHHALDDIVDKGFPSFDPYWVVTALGRSVSSYQSTYSHAY